MPDKNTNNPMILKDLQQDTLFAYQQMAQDKTREDEAIEWCENLIDDLNLTS